MTFWCFYCKLWTLFTTFPGASIFVFEQVNVSWVEIIENFQILFLHKWQQNHMKIEKKRVILYYYCQAAFMKKFVMLMLHFPRPKIPAWKSMKTGRYFPVYPVAKKEVALFVNVNEREKRKQKYTSLWVKHFTSRHWNVTSCRVKVKPLPSGIIFFLKSTLSYLYLVIIQTI